MVGFLIKGKVQRAGFRSRIKDIAKAHGLIGFTKNLQNYDEDVLVVCESDKRKTEGFLSDMKRLQSKQAHVTSEKNKSEKRLSNFINDIVPVQNINEYEKEIREVKYDNNFLIVRDSGEQGDRLDEWIEALVDLRHTTSDINYDIIDTDFALLNVKYGALTGAISSGFEAFPKEFAKAFDTILDKKYGVRPKPQ
jgi:acylphosphatase